jgi:2-hydroxychromene-2-carboxylate isomerase
VSAAIDCYFDFASPYGYIMSQHIDAIAATRHGREVVWRAMDGEPFWRVDRLPHVATGGF